MTLLEQHREELRAGIARNYRLLYERRYDEKFLGTDNEIHKFRAAASGAPTSEDAETWILEDMNRYNRNPSA